MLVLSRTPPPTLLFSKSSLHNFIPISPSSRPSFRCIAFSGHVAPLSPAARSLRNNNNNHGDPHPALYSRHSRVLPNSPPHSLSYPPPRGASIAAPSFPPPPHSFLVVRPARHRTLHFSPLTPYTRFSPPASRMFVSTERLSSAWRHTPMKWNPLPWFVGALLLLLIQYRRYRSEKEVQVDEDGYEVIKLKGPWQVGVERPSFSPLSLPISSHLVALFCTSATYPFARLVLPFFLSCPSGVEHLSNVRKPRVRPSCPR